MKFLVFDLTFTIIFLSVTNFTNTTTYDPAKDYKFSFNKKCNHKKKDYQKYYLSGKYDRKLASTYYTDTQYSKLRILFDYTYTLPYEEKMLKELIMPPVKRFFENTLSVRKFPGKIRIPKSVNSCQEIPVPPHLHSEGYDSDLIIIVSTYRGMKKYYYDHVYGTGISWHEFNGNKKSILNKNNMEYFSEFNGYLSKYFMKSQSLITNKFKTNIENITLSKNSTLGHNNTIPPWEINDGPNDVIGWGFTCAQDIYTLRPIAGVIQYVADINPTQRTIEETIWTTLHEMLHVLALDYDLYSDFINQDYNKLGYENTIKIKTRLKDLNKLLEERKDYLNDIEAFMKFNNSINTLNASKINSTIEIKKSTKLRNFKVAEISKNPINSNKTTINILNNTVNITMSHSETNKTPTITLPLAEEYYEVKIFPKLNLTVLILSIDNFLDQSKFYIKTPKVVEMGRKQFGCSSLEAVELEHFGGLDSALSHWNKRILNTEFMIADSYGENYISNITLALLEDSGWYKVDYSKAETILWGKNKGCDFLEQKCIIKKTKKNSFFTIGLRASSVNDKTKRNFTMSARSNGNSIDTNFKEEFCTSFEEEKCSITHIFRALCGINKYNSSIPVEYQYFDNPQIGGFSQFGDYCPYPNEWIDPITFNPVGSCRNGIQLRKDLGEKICENCRCFLSSLVEEGYYHESKKQLKEKNFEKLLHLDDTRAACYDSKCRRNSDGKMELIIVINDNEIKCPRNGAILSVDSYIGFIECPKVETVCLGTLETAADYPNTSAYNLFANLPQQMLNLLYDFVKYIFKDNTGDKNKIQTE